MLGLFSYYSLWIPKFSDKIRPLITTHPFPLDSESIKTFENFKEEIEKTLLLSVDEKIPLVVETDASDTAIAATLNQANRPVAFFSRTLTTTEQKYSSVEKEACAIVESVKKWCRLISIQIGGHPSYQRKCVNISPISELLQAGPHLITPKETISVNGIMELYENTHY